MEEPDQAAVTTVETPRKRRRGRKRSTFRVPKRMAVPVRALWEHAGEEDRTRAHRIASAILEYWLGRTTKQEVADRLDLPPLRIWQLSQQALSGMLAGLLVQPRKRGTSLMPQDPEDDPKLLRKRIAKLEMELNVAQQLIDLLRELPGNRERELPIPRGMPLRKKTRSESTPKKARKGRGKKRRTDDGDALPSGGSSGGGSMDPGDPPPEG